MKNSSRNYSVVVAWDAGSRKYVASCLEAPACAAASADRMEAIRLAYRAVDQHVAYRRKIGLGSPLPMRRSQSGRILVRTSSALHKALSERALLEGVSLNQYVCLLLTRGVVADGLLSEVEGRIEGLVARLEDKTAAGRRSRKKAHRSRASIATGRAGRVVGSNLAVSGRGNDARSRTNGVLGRRA